MSGCWKKLNGYFFSRDFSSLHGGSLIVAPITYQVFKVVLFLLALGILAYNQTTISYGIGT